jgi:hypothetical protein
VLKLPVLLPQAVLEEAVVLLGIGELPLEAVSVLGGEPKLLHALDQEVALAGGLGQQALETAGFLGFSPDLERVFVPLVLERAQQLVDPLPQPGGELLQVGDPVRSRGAGPQSLPAQVVQFAVGVLVEAAAVVLKEAAEAVQEVRRGDAQAVEVAGDHRR